MAQQENTAVNDEPVIENGLYYILNKENKKYLQVLEDKEGENVQAYSYFEKAFINAKELSMFASPQISEDEKKIEYNIWNKII